jgi:hypothetical protein
MTRAGREKHGIFVSHALSRFLQCTSCCHVSFDVWISCASYSCLLVQSRVKKILLKLIETVLQMTMNDSAILKNANHENDDEFKKDKNQPSQQEVQFCWQCWQGLCVLFVKHLPNADDNPVEYVSPGRQLVELFLWRLIWRCSIYGNKRWKPCVVVRRN